MFWLYFWTIFGLLLGTLLKIYLESEFLESGMATLFQWFYSLLLAFLFFYFLPASFSFVVVVLQVALWSLLALGITYILPFLGEEWFGYGEAEDQGLGPWFFVATFLMVCSCGGLPRLLQLPGFQTLWNTLPSLLIFFVLLQLSISALKIFLQEHFEQFLIVNLFAAFFSCMLSLAFVLGLREKLPLQSAFIATLALSFLSLALWLLLPLLTENLWEWGRCDSQTLKLGLLQPLLILFFLGISETFAFFNTAGETVFHWLDYLPF
jgi:hypothetical protein